MARNVTLTQLRSDITDQADIAGAVGASSRYTTGQLNRWINQAIQRFREKLSNEGVQHYLTHATGSLTAGVTSPFQFGTLDLSAASPAIVRVYGLDVTINSETRTLLHVPFTARSDFGGPTNTGEPLAWANYQTAKLAIFPAPDSTYTYVCWYLPVLADLSSDNDTFDGVAGWEEFIVWEVVCRIITKDQYPQAYQMAVSERDRAWDDILRNATRVTSAGGAVVGRDTLGQIRRWGRRIEPPRN